MLGVFGLLVPSSCGGSAITRVPDTPSRLVVTHVGPAAGVKSPASFTFTVTDPISIRQLKDAVNELPAFPSGTVFCPFDDGSSYRLAFMYEDGSDRDLRLEATGCRGLSVDGSERETAIALNDPQLYALLDELEQRAAQASPIG